MPISEEFTIRLNIAAKKLQDIEVDSWYDYAIRNLEVDAAYLQFEHGEKDTSLEIKSGETFKVEGVPGTVKEGKIFIHFNDKDTQGTVLIYGQKMKIE